MNIAENGHSQKEEKKVANQLYRSLIISVILLVIALTAVAVSHYGKDYFRAKETNQLEVQGIQDPPPPAKEAP